jgi:hypothetical protein
MSFVTSLRCCGCGVTTGTLASCSTPTTTSQTVQSVFCLSLNKIDRDEGHPISFCFVAYPALFPFDSTRGVWIRRGGRWLLHIETKVKKRRMPTDRASLLYYDVLHLRSTYMTVRTLYPACQTRLTEVALWRTSHRPDRKSEHRQRGRHRRAFCFPLRRLACLDTSLFQLEDKMGKCLKRYMSMFPKPQSASSSSGLWSSLRVTTAFTHISASIGPVPRRLKLRQKRAFVLDVSSFV